MMNHPTLKPVVILGIVIFLTLPIISLHDDPYAGPPAWSGKNPTALPPGLQNHSLPAQAWENGLIRFSAIITLVKQPGSNNTAAIKDDIITYYHNDHLGTPIFLTDETGAIVWRREQTPFGETNFERGGVTEPLRFPGQYYDAETCLHYNYFRDAYFPNLGRYAQPDPIGQGGINPNASGDRITNVTDTATQATKGEYVYDGLGRRVKKTAGGVTTYFIYDLTGKLIAEYDGSGDWRNNRAYLDGEPLARFDAGVQDPSNPSASPYETSACLTWDEVAGAGYYVVCWGDVSGNYPNCSGNITGMSYCVDGLAPDTTWYFVVKAYDSGNNIIGQSDEVSARPEPGNPSLPHYSYNAAIGGQADCGLCHMSAGTFMEGYDKKASGELCASCHNVAGVGHGRPYGDSHPVFVSATAGGTKYPTYTNVTGGEYGDTLQTRLVDGQVVCATCHNTMRKPNDPGRSWEYTSSTDNITFTLQNGGWAYYSYLKPVVYRDTALWPGPAYLKDRKQYIVKETEYDVHPDTGTVVFHYPQPAGTNIYVTLGNDYLRNTNVNNQLCLECHVTSTHKQADCAICHGTHNTGNLYNVREKLGTPGGYKAVEYKNASGLSGSKGACVVCHTVTLYHNATSTTPQPHYDNQECISCHPHNKGFPSFTTVLNRLIRKVFAFVGVDYAYASPPAWSGKNPTTLPPGLQNHSLPQQAWENGLKRFSASVSIVRTPVTTTTAVIKDDIIAYYHNDHLGTPMFVTDETGAIVWRREQMPFGEDSFQRGTITENLRMPGQNWDAEKGTSDNGFRTYDQKLGRYIEPNPIGQLGGANIYIYGQANPVMNIDPTGLMVFKCCRNTEINFVIDAATKLFGFKHCFIKTDTKVAGMGPVGGGPLPLNPYHWPTSINDHSKDVASSHCEPYRDVDENCVNRELEIGKSTGLWEFGNNCNTFVDNILRKCKKKSKCNAFSNYSPPHSWDY